MSDRFGIKHGGDVLRLGGSDDPAQRAERDRRTGGEAMGELFGLGRKVDIVDAAMDEYPFGGAFGPDPLAEHHHLHGAGEADQAMKQLRELSARPDIPQPALATLEVTLAALVDPPLLALAVDRNLRAAELGPAQSLATVIHLAGLGEPDAALRVAEGHLLRRGSVSVGVHKTATDPSITDQHRRVTQMLFLPVTAGLRRHPQFLGLCENMGLAAYWDEAGVIPDFLNGQAGSNGNA